ncbi:MAG: FAD-binding oxidoreductase [Deltaproteobacteria bacterium]|nr:FAD-binding oxidoreductase [Deltaproteobacteria bacterium]
MGESRPADTVVIGGGCVGLSVAHALARLGRGGIVLVEREAVHGAGSTGLGAGGVRAQFSTDINIRLSIESMRIFADFERETGAPLAYEPIGYLFLAATDHAWRELHENNARQRAHGVPADLLSPRDVAARFGFLDSSRLCGAAWCPVDGVTDPHAVVQGYASAARRLGVEMAMSTAARALRFDAARSAWMIETDRGGITAQNVVIAAGVWSPAPAASVGVDLPIRPLRRVCFVARADDAPSDLPFVIDTATGFWMRPETGGVVMGMPRADEPHSFILDMDLDLWTDVLDAGSTVAPFVAGARRTGGWAGLYEMTPDLHPIVGAVPGRPGMFVAAGFSGHGFMHAPAVGRHLAHLIAHGRSALDLTPLSPARFARSGFVSETRYV